MLSSLHRVDGASVRQCGEGNVRRLDNNHILPPPMFMQYHPSYRRTIRGGRMYCSEMLVAVTFAEPCMPMLPILDYPFEF